MSSNMVLCCHTPPLPVEGSPEKTPLAHAPLGGQPWAIKDNTWCSSRPCPNYAADPQGRLSRLLLHPQLPLIKLVGEIATNVTRGQSKDTISVTFLKSYKVQFSSKQLERKYVDRIFDALGFRLHFLQAVIYGSHLIIEGFFNPTKVRDP